MTFINICFYLLLEWIFLVTKPSFFGSDSYLVQIRTVLFSISFFTLIGYILITLLYGVSLKFGPQQQLFKEIALAFPIAILSALTLIFVDNFTYTVFNFGIATTDRLRFIYLVFLAAAMVYAFGFLNKQTHKLSKKLAKLDDLQKFAIPVIFAMQIIILAATVRFNPDLGKDVAAETTTAKTPDIFIFTADGVNAAHMSVYGYERETTPFLEELAQSSLVAENAFSNAGTTTGSLTSIYTGKFPTATRVLFSPDILKDEDSYEHLPGILNELGYTTVQFSYPYYADAYDFNLRDGFDFANGRGMSSSGFTSLISKTFDSDESYFIYLVSNRIVDRLLHVTYIKDMDKLNLLADGTAQFYNYKSKFALAYEIAEESPNPVFVHIHYMRSHGPVYYPDSRVFSAGKDMSAEQEYDLDFYDDTILDFDLAVEQFVADLKSAGLYENSIIVIGSDHGLKYQPDVKIPLMVHFPNDEYAKKITANVQNLDMAPTILSYLKIAQPEWMAGTPLQSDDLEPTPVFNVGITRYHMDGDNIVSSNNVPPFYQFGYINLISCNQSFRLDLNSQEWSSAEIEGYSGECAAEDLISDRQAFVLMRDHLRENGFNISSLQAETLALVHQ